MVNSGPARTDVLDAADDGGVGSGLWALTVLRNLPQAVVVLALDPEGVWSIVAANDAAAELTGYGRPELLVSGRDLLAVTGLRPDAERQFDDALAKDARTSLTVLARRADGREYWVALELAPIPAQRPGERLWVVVVRDVSAQVEAAHLERVRLEIERRARVGLGLVARVSDILQDADGTATLRSIGDLLARQVVEWAGFVVLGRALREVDAVTHDPLPTPRLPARDESSPPDPVRELFERSVMRTLSLDSGGSYDESSLTGELLELIAPRVREHEADHVLVLPVLGRRRTLALLVVVPRVPDETEPDGAGEGTGTSGPPDVEVRDETGTILELVARRVGMAMDNAQLYAREHLLAETLQRAMLPEMDEVQGLDVWTYYAPSVEHAQVGGDWYDVVNLHDDLVAVVIGDVVGHDVEAAAAMGQLRSVVRAFAAELVDPATVLGRVDALVTGMRIPRTASLVYAILTPAPDESWELAYSRAGHLPPLRIRDGEVTLLDEAGGPLVGFGSGTRTTARTRVEPGDVIVLYTDGLVERRDRPLRAGLDALVDLCAAVQAPDAAGVGEEILQLADKPEDDVAVVVLRVPGGETGGSSPAAPRRRRWQMPVDAASIGRGRHAVRRACEAWGIDNVAGAELVVSELLANAVMHGWGRLGLRLQDTGAGLRIEVEDGNPAPPTTRDRHTTRVGGFGMHIVDRLADWGWRPTPDGKVVWARLRSDSPRPTGSESAPGEPDGSEDDGDEGTD